jgi:hypothetical protein
MAGRPVNYGVSADKQKDALRYAIVTKARPAWLCADFIHIGAAIDDANGIAATSLR